MKKILIIGESCRDIFVYCDAYRLCPDIPVPALNVIDQTENPGMAKNVERNVRAVGGVCDIVTNIGWEGVTKTRYMHKASNHMFIRVDTEHNIPRINIGDLKLSDYDIVAISDYNKGYLLNDDIKYICENHDNVFIDTKKILGDWAKCSRFIKINNYEYEHSKSSMPSYLEDKIICTKGGDGAMYKGRLYPVKHKVEVKDTSGAGDSFFSALLVKYAETDNIEESIEFANECASKVVQQKGVSVIG